MNLPRLVFIGPIIPQSGASYAIELAAQLRQVGYHCILSSPQRNPYLRLLDVMQTLITQSRKIDVLMLQVFSGRSFILSDIASQLSHAMGHRIVMTLHGGAFSEFQNKNPGWVKRVLGRADIITTPSQFLVNHLAAPGVGISARVIPNAINLAGYPFRLREKPRPNLIWLRAFHEIYNPCMAVQALSHLAQEFPEIRLVMVGPDKKDGAYQKVIQETMRLGVSDKIELRGIVPHDEVPNLLSNSDIFLNTTHFESFGLSACEAAAMGCCLVTTDVGELSYLWKHKENAMLVADSDDRAMAAAVKEILTEPGLAKRLSGNAREKTKLFDWSIVLPQWQSLFTEKILQVKQ